MTTCPNGHENPGNQRFCGECGARLRTADTPASAERERVEQQDYRPVIVAAIAASVGVMVGSVGSWVTAGMFSFDGLTDWEGKTTLTLGAISCIAMVVEFFWSRTPFNPRWAVPLAWATAVAGVACVSYAVPFLIRVMTLPKASFFGVPVGAEVGWGLWLLALSSAVMCVAASIVATRIPRSIDVRSNASWTTHWRWAAIVASAVVAISAIVYYSVNWEGSSGSSEASPTAMPWLPGFPSLPSLSARAEQPTRTSTATWPISPPALSSAPSLSTPTSSRPSPAIFVVPGTRYAFPAHYDESDPIRERPTNLRLTVRFYQLTNLTWTAWGSDGADGSGIEFTQTDCDPSCTEGTHYRVPVRIHAFNPQPPPSDSGCPADVADVLFYSEIVLTYLPTIAASAPRNPSGKDFQDTTDNGLPAVHYWNRVPYCDPVYPQVTATGKP